MIIVAIAAEDLLLDIGRVMKGLVFGRAPSSVVSAA